MGSPGDQIGNASPPEAEQKAKRAAERRSRFLAAMQAAQGGGSSSDLLPDEKAIRSVNDKGANGSGKPGSLPRAPAPTPRPPSANGADLETLTVTAATTTNMLKDNSKSVKSAESIRSKPAAPTSAKQATTSMRSQLARQDFARSEKSTVGNSIASGNVDDRVVFSKTEQRVQKIPANASSAAEPATNSCATDATSFLDIMITQASQGFVSRLEHPQSPPPVRSANGVVTLPRVVGRGPGVHRAREREDGDGNISNDESNDKRKEPKDEASEEKIKIHSPEGLPPKSRFSFQGGGIHALDQSMNELETDLRLDQDWEQSYTPPNYTWKMRRKREAEILQQRALLGDCRKMNLHLDAGYKQFQVALKSEERQRDRWNDSLIKARHRVGKHVEASNTAQQQNKCRQAKLDDLSRRVELCQQIIQDAASTKEHTLQQSMAAIEEQEKINTQVKLMLQDSHPAINQFLEDLSLQPVRSPVDQPLPPLPTLGDAPTRSVIERMPVPGPQDLEGQMDLLRRLAQVFNGPVPYKAATDAALPMPMKHERQHNAAATPHYSFIPHDSNGAQGEAVWHQWGEQQSHELYQWEEQQSHLPTAEPYFLQPPACVNPSVDVEQGGIGLLLGMDPEGSCSVDAVLPGGPADMSGKVKPGDRLLSVNGTSLIDMSLDEITSLFSGPVGTHVFLAIDTGTMVRTVELIRSRVQVPSEGVGANRNLGLEGPPQQRDQYGYIQPESSEAPAHVPAYTQSLLPLPGQEARGSIRQLRDFLLGVSKSDQGIVLQNTMSFDEQHRHRLGIENRLNAFSTPEEKFPATRPSVHDCSSEDRFPATRPSVHRYRANPRRIALVAHGWQHDIEPFLSLSNELVRAGHTVYVAAPERYMPRFQEADADWFIPLENDPHVTLRGKIGIELMAALDGNDSAPLRDFSAAMPTPSSHSNAAAIWHACAGNRSFCASLSQRAHMEAAALKPGSKLDTVECIIFHGCVCTMALSVAEALAIPAIGVVISSETLPSLKPVDSDRRTQGHTVPGPYQPALRNSWCLASQAQAVNNMLYVRREMGLPLSVHEDTGLCMCQAEPLGWLLAASPLLPPFPRLDFDECRDVLQDSIVTGAWLPDDSKLLRLDPAVEAELALFTQNGAPLVYVSFAGLAAVSRKMLGCVMLALQRLRFSAILDGDFEGISEDELDGGGAVPVLLVHNVPLAPVLARCSFVIHHGNPGTFHAALEAGLPQVMVPVYGDQMYWADAAASFNIGPLNPASLQHLTPDRLEQMVAEALSQNTVAAASNLGVREQEERRALSATHRGGAHHAAVAIDSLLSHPKLRICC